MKFVMREWLKARHFTKKEIDEICGKVEIVRGV